MTTKGGDTEYPIHRSRNPLKCLGTPFKHGPHRERQSRNNHDIAVSKGTLTITDKENRKQDIEKLNRNIEDSLKKLKEIFDNKSRRKTGTHPHDEHSGEPNHP